MAGRRWVIVGSIAGLFLGVMLLCKSWVLLRLITDSTASLVDNIDPAQIALLEAKNNYDDLLRIPKILHQTWVNESVPKRWETAQQSCLYYHADWDYWLWTDQTARNFIDMHYHWFIQTFDAYPHPIQRVDAVRYFILYHYGGVYLDLDLNCRKSFEPLLTVTGWLRMTTPVGISNDSMGFAKHHPFLEYVIQKLQNSAHSYVIPYATVMFSTGPMFLSLRWKEWLMKDLSRDDGRIWVMAASNFENVDAEEAQFMASSGGSTWHEGDAAFVKLLFRHAGLTSITMVGIVGCIAYAVYKCTGGKLAHQNGGTLSKHRRRSSDSENGY